MNNFKDILIFLRNPDNNLPTYYNSINHSVNLSFYVFIRNSLVHNPNEIEYISENQNPILLIRDIPYKRRYGIFNEYIESEFLQYKGKKFPNTFQQYIDDRFPYVQFEFWLNKNSNIDIQKTKIGFKMGIIELSKKMLSDIFILQKDMFKIINKLE